MECGRSTNSPILMSATSRFALALRNLTIPESRGVEYIGAVLWEADDASLPDWIEALPADRPIIWVYSGNPRYGSADTTLDSIVGLEGCLRALGGVDASNGLANRPP